MLWMIQLLVHLSLSLSLLTTSTICLQRSLSPLIITPFSAHPHIPLNAPSISHSAADPQCPSLPRPAFCAPSYHLYIVFHPVSESTLQSPFPDSRFHFFYLAVNAIQFSFIFPLYPQQALPRSAINFS